MDRQWQRRGRGHYDTLPSQDEFVRQLPPLPVHGASSTKDSVGTGASLGDLYAVFSALHAQCRAPEVRASATGGFYYLLASLPQEALLGGKAGVRQQQALARQQGHAGQALVDIHAIREAVVPVGAKAGGATLQRLQGLFQHIQEGGDGHVLLAVVDGPGAVSLMRLFNYIQAPFEGPEALPQQVSQHQEQQGGDEDEGLEGMQQDDAMD